MDGALPGALGSACPPRRGRRLRLQCRHDQASAGVDAAIWAGVEPPADAGASASLAALLPRQLTFCPARCPRHSKGASALLEASDLTMRVLLVHGYYKDRGGEDVAFETDARLLANAGHEVKTLPFYNAEIGNALSLRDRLSLA